jgi:RNA polymerase sigma-70 factor (ECF subfamily)
VTTQLVERSVAGDADALAELVKRYHDRVYRFGRRVCRDGYDADDAVQLAFITLSRRPDMQQSKGVLSWLMTVVKNACLAMLAPLSRRSPLSAAAEASHEVLSADEALEHFELVSKVHAAIDALDSESRAVIVLRDLEGLSGEETAERLGLTLAGMKTRLHRARLAVRSRVMVS